VEGCPAGIDIPRYVGYVALGKFGEAAAVVRERIPFPSICGHICYRPCEPKCRRAFWESPVAINALKRVAAENDTGLWRTNWSDTIAPPTGKRVAIVGSGPAGLTAAYYLGKVCGHEVTVFEAASKPGGQLRLGIPANRLPREVIDREISVIAETRVEIRCNERVTSLDELFSQGYDAVFVSAGTMKPKKLGISGEDLPGVWEGVRFLQEAHLSVEDKKTFSVNQRVAVIGGGNVAVDCARTARRLGATEVAINYRRSRQEMPAYDFEMRSAEMEGVKAHFLAAPVRIERGGEEGELRLHLIRMRLGDRDSSGRRQSEPVRDGEFSILVNQVLVAIGQVPNIPSSWNLEANENGTIKVDPETLGTSRRGVFAGGDVALGSMSFIEGVAHGRRASEAIDLYLGGNGDIEEVLAPSPAEEMELHPGIKPNGSNCVPMEEVAADKRVQSFEIVEKGYSKEQGQEEALRCVRCDLWGVKGIPVVWWKNRGLQPYWIGDGVDRMSRDLDQSRVKVVGPYSIQHDHAPYIPAEYLTVDGE
jgi:NADPH-dependent glutamate synthase beta subunit-like oxidoreductase